MIAIIGLGYVGRYLKNQLQKDGLEVICIARKEQEECKKIHEIKNEFKEIEAIISTAPPGDEDPLCKLLQENEFLNLQYIGYCSSTGVYGNHFGAKVDENTKCNPISQEAEKRVKTEIDIIKIAEAKKLPKPHIFRLSGIYGPGRNAVENIMQQKEIILPHGIINRIHVHDIVNCIWASLKNSAPGIYCLSDQNPSLSIEPYLYAAHLLDLNLKNIQYREMKYGSKIIINTKFLKTWNLDLLYPSYKKGLEAITKI